MQNHVRVEASSHASEQRMQLLRLMEMAKKTACFDPDRSVRARKIKSTAADGSESTITVMFIRTGKESVLDSIESWFSSREDQKLGRQISEAAFPGSADIEEKTVFQSFFGKDRITVRTLYDKVPPHLKISAAFRVSCQEAAEAFGAVLGNGPGMRSPSGKLGLSENATVYIRSCLGLSARSNKAKADEMFEEFSRLVTGIQSTDWKLENLEVRQRLVERAREFCTAWTQHKAQKPERHAHTVRTHNLVVLDELVACFEKSFPA
jgi:hypothetical protein